MFISYRRGYTVKFKLSILLLAFMSPILFVSPALARDSSYPVAPGGSCNRYHGFTGSVQGNASVKTIGKVGPKTTYQVKVEGSGLTPGKTFQVWFGDLYLNKSGRIIGCGALQAGNVKADKNGRFHAEGKVTESTNFLPKQIFIVTSFNGTGLVSGLLYL